VDEFAVGDTVQVTGKTMTGNVGTIISVDEQRGKYLVLISNVTQNYFAAEELKTFSATA
jgi:transcription antitermination factor NusG